MLSSLTRCRLAPFRVVFRAESTFAEDLLPFRRRAVTPVRDGIPQVTFTFVRNNTFAAVSNAQGRLLFALSAGRVGFKNAQKTEPRAALALVDGLRDRMIAKPKTREGATGTESDNKAKPQGATDIRVNLRGLNPTRAIVVGQLRRVGFRIAELIDTTGVPHNGCRPKKARRL